jgi:hypothetical protein
MRLKDTHLNSFCLAPEFLGELQSKVLLDTSAPVGYTIIAIEKGEYRGRGTHCGFGQMLRRCVQETKVLKGINFLGVNVNYFTK